MRFSEEEKAMWLEDWRQSGKNAWAYAKENGIIPQTFARWAKAKTGNKCRFVEIPAAALPEIRNQEMVIEKGEVKIHVPVTVGAGELRTIISALGGAA